MNDQKIGLTVFLIKPDQVSAVEKKLLGPGAGASNSTIICPDIVMTLARPLRAVVSRTTGPGSSNW